MSCMMMSSFETLDFGTSHRKVKKSLLTLPQVKFVLKMIFKKIKWKLSIFVSFMDLWKYGSILTIKKSLIIN
jgi:hypothetical protein